MSVRLGNKDVKLVSTKLELKHMMTKLNDFRPRIIAVSADGKDLSRNGTLTLLALRWNDRVVYVIDVQELGSSSFSQIFEDFDPQRLLGRSERSPFVSRWSDNAPKWCQKGFRRTSFVSRRTPFVSRWSENGPEWCPIRPRRLLSAVRRSGDGFKWSSVKEVLEDPDLLKLFCDPRSDSDALYHHYGVLLRNVYCVQLGEVAVRCQAGLKSRFVKGAKKITQEFGRLSLMEWAEWEGIDRAAGTTFIPGRGGSSDNLMRRPLNSLALKYSALGVLHLRRIFDNMEDKLSRSEKEWVKEESRKRVEECLLPIYFAGYQRAVAPRDYQIYWRPSSSIPELRFVNDVQDDDHDDQDDDYDDQDDDYDDQEDMFPNGFYHDEYGHYVPRPY